MGRPRFTPEFKDEAVRQVIERGHSVVDVASRLGVSSHSLYKWVKDAKPSKNEERSDELLESKKEVQALRAEEERDILKKAAAYFARESE
ncbi:MAG: transposase [Myxococcota bacterium]|jgi:transposase